MWMKKGLKSKMAIKCTCRWICVCILNTFILILQVHGHIYLCVVKIYASVDTQIRIYRFFYICTCTPVLKVITSKLRILQDILHFRGKG